MKYYLIALGGACAVTEMPILHCTVKVNARQLKTYSTRKCKMSTLSSGHYLRNRSTLDIGVLGYIGIVQHKEHSPEVLSLPPGTSCIFRQRIKKHRLKQRIRSVRLDAAPKYFQGKTLRACIVQFSACTLIA